MDQLDGNPMMDYLTLHEYSAATDPVRGPGHSMPILPGHGDSKAMEYWEEELHKRRQRRRPPIAPEKPPKEKPSDDSHHIDGYA
ncbi:MAG TPA: hypothetical protein VGK14_02045 [Novimethylophilus sp.]|uniref:hypothetical protein n=1 Tax=Novimethylophilus sp. TaxID=2137426 RepID=UPI002F41841A